MRAYSPNLLAEPKVPVRLAGRATDVYHCPSEYGDVAGTVLSILLEERGHAAPETRVKAARALRRV
jgi:hypothetical protein